MFRLRFRVGREEIRNKDVTGVEMRKGITANRWFILFFILLVIGKLASMPLLMILATALAVSLGVAFFWQKYALHGVVYRRRFFYIRGFPGERIPLRIEVENRKLLPLSWLRTQDPWPKIVGPENIDILAPSHHSDQGLLTHVFSLRWFGRSQRNYTLVFRKRGVYRVGPALLESGDLFGFYECTKLVGPVEQLTIFPALLPSLSINLAAENPFGERGSRRQLFEDPSRPMGVRDYQPQDSFRQVHWPATAHTGQLQVKVYQPTSSPVMVLCLNVSTYARYWEGVYPELLEHMLRMTATLANQGIQDGFQVGLISNGCLSNSDQPFRIPPGRTAQHLAQLLTVLAGVTAITVAPFERFLLKEIPQVPFGATLVIITAITSPELLETLLRLKRHERRVTLISLAEQAPVEIPGVASIHRPYDLRAYELQV